MTHWWDHRFIADANDKLLHLLLRGAKSSKGHHPHRESEPQPLNPHQYGAAIHFLLWHCFFQQDLGCKKGKSSAVVSLSSPGPCDQTLEVCSSGKLERAEPLENQ